MPESGLPGEIYSKAGPLNIFCPIPSIPENCGGDSPISNPPGTDFIRILRYRSFLLPTPLSSHRSCSMPHRNVFPSAENIFRHLRCRFLPPHLPSHALPPQFFRHTLCRFTFFRSNVRETFVTLPRACPLQLLSEPSAFHRPRNGAPVWFLHERPLLCQPLYFSKTSESVRPSGTPGMSAHPERRLHPDASSGPNGSPVLFCRRSDPDHKKSGWNGCGLLMKPEPIRWRNTRNENGTS